MKKIFSLLIVCLMATMLCKAEERKFRFIDYVNVEQSIDLDTCQVYIVPTSFAETNPKKKKSQAKQEAALTELGATVQKLLKSAFKKATYQVIENKKDAPAGAVIVEATLKEIEWGTATSVDVMFGAKAEVHGSYNVRVSNANGVVMEFENRRAHNTALKDNPVGIIRTYHNAMVGDLISILKNIK